jgi:hypothetical protein
VPRASSVPNADQLAFVLELETDPEVVADEGDVAGADGGSPEPDQVGAGRATAAEQEPVGEPRDDASEVVPDDAVPRRDLTWRAVLDFERGWSGPPGAKQRAIRASFGVSSARYHQQLDRALGLPDAVAFDAVLVRRLRRVRETRRAKRFARRVDVGFSAGAEEDGSRGG